jgi:hypothetical protein
MKKRECKPLDLQEGKAIALPLLKIFLPIKEECCQIGMNI